MLTDTEREKITDCIDGHGGVCREVMCSDSLDNTIAHIIAAREKALAEKIAQALYAHDDGHRQRPAPWQHTAARIAREQVTP